MRNLQQTNVVRWVESILAWSPLRLYVETVVMSTCFVSDQRGRKAPWMLYSKASDEY